MEQVAEWALRALYDIQVSVIDELAPCAFLDPMLVFVDVSSLRVS
jgi:hypothetical protein